MTITVQALKSYPVKSCRGIALQRASISSPGIQYDRRWMVIDPKTGAFRSQRSHPMMARIRVAIAPPCLVLSIDDHTDECVVPLRSPPAPTRIVTVHKKQCVGVDQGQRAEEWLSDILGDRCALVAMPEVMARTVLEDEIPDARTAYADGSPVLIVSQESLYDLNVHLRLAGESSVPMDRFRPNIVVSGTIPYEEDGWRRIRIGNVVLRAAHRCGRCAIVNTDQETGERTQEPLRTLAVYRPREKGAPTFGTNYAPESLHGPITLTMGDRVEVLE